MSSKIISRQIIFHPYIILLFSGLKKRLENVKAATMKTSAEMMENAIELSYRILHCGKAKRQKIEALLEED